MLPFFKKNKSAQLLNQLKSLDVYKNHEYEGETKEKIEEFQKELNNIINECIENGIQYDKIKKINEKAHELKNAFNECKEKREAIKKEINEYVEKGVEFVTSTNFYPPEYVFHLNKLQGMTLDIEEDEKVDPLTMKEEYLAFKIQIQEDIEQFKELHRETIDLIEKIDKKVKEKEKKESQEILEIKEKLFRHLQMGQIQETRSHLKKLKKEYKKI